MMYLLNRHSLVSRPITSALPNYTVIHSLSSSKKIIKNNNVYALIDQSDNVIIPYSSNTIRPTSNENFVVLSNGRLNGIYSINGDMIIPIVFDGIQIVGDLFIVRQSNVYSDTYGIYSCQGELVFPVEYDLIELLTSNIIRLSKKDEQRSDNCQNINILYFINERKTFSAPLGDLEILSNGNILCLSRYDHGHKDILISQSGQLLSPSNTEKIDRFDNNSFTQICVSFRNLKRYMTAIIDINGSLFIKKGVDILPMPSNYEWVSNFDNGIADAILCDHLVHLDSNFRKVVKVKKNNMNMIVNLPMEYLCGLDSECEYIKVLKDGLMGIIGLNGIEIVAPKYYFIKIITDLSDNITRFICYTKMKQFPCETIYEFADIYNEKGLKINENLINDPVYVGHGFFRSYAKTLKIQNETNDSHYSSEKEVKIDLYQILDSNCKSISNLLFRSIFQFGRNNNQQRDILNPLAKTNCYEDESFDTESPYAIFMQENGTFGVINLDGDILLNNITHQFEIGDIPSLLLSDNYSPALLEIGDVKISLKGKDNYKSIDYVGYGLFLVRYNITMANSFKECSTYINIFNDPLSPISGNVSEIKNQRFVSTIEAADGDQLSGIFDIRGNIIVPFCNLSFHLYNNFILGSKLYGGTHTIYSYEGQVIMSDITLYAISDFLDCYILIQFRSREHCSLLDLKGKVIYSDYYYYKQVLPGLLLLSSGEDSCYLGDLWGNVLTPRYDNIEVFKNGLCVVSRRKVIGYTYDIFGHAHNSYKVFYGVIDYSGNEIVPLQYDFIHILEDNNLIRTPFGNMTCDGRFITFFESPDGLTQLILEKKYDYCLPFNNGFAIAKSNNRFGIINTLGEETFPCICSKIVYVEGTIYKFRINKLWGIFDVCKGINIINKYSQIGKFCNGIAIVSYAPCDNVKYFGLISCTEVLIDPICNYIRILDETTIAYAFGGELGYAVEWSLYDTIKKQRIFSNKNFTFIGNNRDGFVRFSIGGIPNYQHKAIIIDGGKWGFMTPRGQVIVEEKYDKCLDFFGNVAPVKLNGKWGFINKVGELIVSAQYDRIEKWNLEYKVYSTINDKEMWFLFNGDGIIRKSGMVEDKCGEDYDDDASFDDYSYGSDVHKNPYYDENLDMDQQSQEFWDSL